MIRIALLAILILVTIVPADLQAYGDLDQYMLELINRARAEPANEIGLVSWTGGILNEGLIDPDTISNLPKQPLIFDTRLNDAAKFHTDHMISYDYFGHQDETRNEPSIFARMENAGFPPAFGWGENIAAAGGSLATSDSLSVDLMHKNLFIDADVIGRGHRVNMLNDNFQAIGLDIQHADSFAPLLDLQSDLVTQDFAYKTAFGPFLTGVAFSDTNEDDFYTPGEGLFEVIVTAYQTGTLTVVGTTKTISTGGYSLPLIAGTYDVVITGPLGTVTKNEFVIGAINVKLDYKDSTLDQDIIGPKPDPMTFTMNPTAVGSSTITMIATTATDDSGVEYYFEETTGNPGAVNSGWQDSSSYTNANLQEGTTYAYHVRVRDKSTTHNTTAWSSLVTETLPLGNGTDVDDEIDPYTNTDNGGINGGCSVAPAACRSITGLLSLLPLGIFIVLQRRNFRR